MSEEHADYPDPRLIRCKCGELLGIWMDVGGKARPVPAVRVHGEIVAVSWIPKDSFVGYCAKCGEYTARTGDGKSLAALMDRITKRLAQNGLTWEDVENG